MINWTKTEFTDEHIEKIKFNNSFITSYTKNDQIIALKKEIRRLLIMTDWYIVRHSEQKLTGETSLTDEEFETLSNNRNIWREKLSS